MTEALLFVLAGALAFANGANDNFKGVATLHGSGTLGYRGALAWATITTLAGSVAAVILGGKLAARFSGRGLVADAIVTDPSFLGAVALGATAAVLLATRLGLPVSTTHALMGSLLGAGLALAGPTHLSYATLGRSFVMPLLLSPVVALVLTSGVYVAFRSAGRALGMTEQTCVCIGGVEHLATYVPGGGAVRLASGLTVTVDQLERCQRRYAGAVLGFDAQSLVSGLHVVTSGAVGFARALNDTPKIAALMLAAPVFAAHDPTMLVAVLMAAGGMAARRVGRTLSFGITAMNPAQGASANLVTAALVTLASPLGLPVSTTHVSGGALFGIGAVNGEARGSTIARILGAWVTTAPLAAVLAALAAAGTSWR